MEAMLKGGLAGLAYGMLLGPLFFLSLQVTLNQGLRNGLALAIGAFASDATLAFGGWWSSAQLFTLVRQESFQSGMGAFGALLIIGFGISAIWPRKNKAARRSLSLFALARAESSSPKARGKSAICI